jgi:hypothetical protein
MSLREEFAQNIVKVLKDMQDPKPVLVTREPFDVEKLAISQFPAILISTGNETREDVSMKSILRQGTIQYTIRAFVRGGGAMIDRLKNDIIERIEETLDLDRTRGTGNRNMLTRVISITVPDRLQPLAEVLITVEVRYVYQKGQN